MKLFAGSSNPNLAKNIAKKLRTMLFGANVFRFSDGEIGVKIRDSILRSDVYVLQTSSAPVNDMLMELFIMIDAFKRGGAKSISAIMPYMAYSRKDKKDVRQDPISAKLIANLLETAGIDSLITLDLHADALEGFFDVPVVNLSAMELFAREYQDNIDDLVVVAPDMGGAKRARRFARILGVPVVILEKMRAPNSKNSEVMTIIGDVSGKRCVITDDIISSGGTLINAASILKEKGAKEITVCATHGVLVDDASDRLQKSSIEKIYITDSIPLSKEKAIDKIAVLSIAGLIADEIEQLQVI